MAATEEQIKEDQLKWSSAPNYAAVLHLNRQYLHGEAMTTPYDHFPVGNENKPGTDVLRLHDYGFLVYDWVSGGHAGPLFAPGALPSDLSDTCKNHYYELQKRDCVRLLAPVALFEHDALKTFLRSLQAHPDIVTGIIGKGLDRLFPHTDIAESSDVRFSLHIGTRAYPIIRRRLASTVIGLTDAVYETCAWAGPDPKAPDLSAWKCDALSRALPLEFWVATKRWDGMVRVGVLVKELALAAGLKAVFDEVAEGGVGLRIVSSVGGAQ